MVPMVPKISGRKQERDVEVKKTRFIAVDIELPLVALLQCKHVDTHHALVALLCARI